uniref:DUF4836 family protein n=1 Tax=Prevotella sp. TaxID=59823 RepID=UPI0040254C27
MKIYNYFRITLALWAFCFLSTVGILSSCSGSEYINAIPSESQMLIRLNPAKLSGTNSPLILKTLLHLKDLDESGIDLSKDVFFFEDGQGNFGLCAKVSSDSKLEKSLQKAGLSLTKRRDYKFAALSSGWVIGFSDNTALLMGPVVPAAQDDLITLMARYLGSDEDQGIKSSPMYATSDSIDAPMSIVAQTCALPQQFVAPFTMGAPKDADPADVILAAAMEVKNGHLLMHGKTLSYKKSINSALVKAANVYRPIKGEYIKAMSQDDVLGLFLNVDGKQFHNLMIQNRAATAMLAGINTAIDMDNIIKSVNGDLTLVTSSLGKDNFRMMMAARLSGAPWLADIDYWKKSVPAGGHIGDWGKNCYYYSGNGTTYFFGVTQDMQYMSGASPEEAKHSITTSPKPLSPDLQKIIKGKKLAMVVNFKALGNSKAAAITSLLMPMFGNINTIVYTTDK